MIQHSILLPFSPEMTGICFVLKSKQLKIDEDEDTPESVIRYELCKVILS